MSHQRFRKFNTRDMYPDQTIDNDMCMIVKAGRRTVVISRRGAIRGLRISDGCIRGRLEQFGGITDP